MSRFMKLFPSVNNNNNNENWQNDDGENKIYFNDVSRDLVRCVECRSIILKNEIFNCDECDGINLNNRILCQYCGLNNHRHSTKSTPTPAAAASAIVGDNSGSSTMENSTTTKKADVITKNISVDSGNHSAGGSSSKLLADRADLFDLKNRTDAIFEFVRGGLAELERESDELEKRRIDAGYKKDQFRTILARFETEIRDLMADNGGSMMKKNTRPFDTDPMMAFARQQYYVVNNNNNDQQRNVAGAGLDQSLLSDDEDECDRGSIVDDFQNVPIERQVFVGGLPSRVREAELKQIFAGYGPVVGVKILSKIPGKNACAFVAFETVDAARDALRSPPPFQQFWHGNRCRRLYVEAKCSTSMVNLPDNFKIRISNLPTGVRLLELKQFFEKHGKVLGAKLRFRRGEPWRIGCAYVAFESKETAARVAAHKTFDFGKNARRIYVELAGNNINDD